MYKLRQGSRTALATSQAPALKLLSTDRGCLWVTQAMAIGVELT